MTKPSAKKTQSETKEPSPGSVTEAKKVDLSDPELQRAIDQGLALIKDGKSKADAARAIYDLLETQGKDVIVAAFVAGATLTEKGALTYWYNCRRKKSKGQAQD